MPIHPVSSPLVLSLKIIPSPDKPIQMAATDMTFCTRCDTEAGLTAMFCSSCGNSLKAAMEPRVVSSRERTARRNQNAAARVEQRGSPAGVVAYKALSSEKSLSRMKSLAAGGIGALLAVATFLAHGRVYDVVTVALALCTLGAFIATLWFHTPERLSRAQYQALPGAVTDRGHQCVFCGWRGIYRHTPYKTDTTLADCAKCEAELWHE